MAAAACCGADVAPARRRAARWRRRAWPRRCRRRRRRAGARRAPSSSARGPSAVLRGLDQRARRRRGAASDGEHRLRAARAPASAGTDGQRQHVALGVAIGVLDPHDQQVHAAQRHRLLDAGAGDADGRARRTSAGCRRNAGSASSSSDAVLADQQALGAGAVEHRRHVVRRPRSRAVVRRRRLDARTSRRRARPGSAGRAARRWRETRCGRTARPGASPSTCPGRARRTAGSATGWPPPAPSRPRTGAMKASTR